MAQGESRLRRLRWRSRRGLLELDLFLEPFLRDCLDELPEALLERYEQLLDHPDPEILQWLQAQADPPEALAQITGRIRAHALAR